MAFRVCNEFGDNESDSPAARTVDFDTRTYSEVKARSTPLELSRDLDVAEPSQIVTEIGNPSQRGRRIFRA